MSMVSLSDAEFVQIRDLIYSKAGISMSTAKKSLVVGRLAKRLRAHNLASYSDYLRLLDSGEHPDEMQMAVDLLTTNETYFFREPKHFTFLQERILPQHAAGRPFRVWSAASSSGQEPYSIAMILAQHLGHQPWEVLASDISLRVLEKARVGHYPMEQAKNIPPHYLSDYCLKGVGSHEGTFLINRQLRERVTFQQINLNTSLPQTGEFDLVFLRNVMIYFDTETKRQVVRRLMERIKPGGHLFIGHSESLNGIVDYFQTVMPSVYRKPR
jgi:chemotaxis protein methyltransferase CheR